MAGAKAIDVSISARSRRAGRRLIGQREDRRLAGVEMRHGDAERAPHPAGVVGIERRAGTGDQAMTGRPRSRDRARGRRARRRSLAAQTSRTCMPDHRLAGQREQQLVDAHARRRARREDDRRDHAGSVAGLGSRRQPAHARSRARFPVPSGIALRTRPRPCDAVAGVDVNQHFGPIDIYLFDQILRGRIAPGDVIVDAGCGMGRNLVFLLREGYDVYGLDADPDAIADLVWNPVGGATSYNVKRGTSTGTYTTTTSAPSASFTDTTVSNGTTYYYVVTAIIGAESANSSEVTGTPTRLRTSASSTAGDGGGGNAADSHQRLPRALQPRLADCQSERLLPRLRFAHAQHVDRVGSVVGNDRTRPLLSRPGGRRRWWHAGSSHSRFVRRSSPRRDCRQGRADHAPRPVELRRGLSVRRGNRRFRRLRHCELLRRRNPAPAPGNNTAVIRANNGCTDTNNNAGDFTVTASTPIPRNSGTASFSCGALSNNPPSINAPANPAATVTENAAPFGVNLSGNDDGGVYTWSANPGAGVASVTVSSGQSTSSVTYSVTLQTNFTGTASFTATLSDNVYAPVSRTVNIQVNAPVGTDNAPTINPPANPITTVAQEAPPFTVGLTGNDDHGVYNWSATPGTGVASVNVTGGRAPAPSRTRSSSRAASMAPRRSRRRSATTSIRR